MRCLSYSSLCYSLMFFAVFGEYWCPKKIIHELLSDQILLNRINTKGWKAEWILMSVVLRRLYSLFFISNYWNFKNILIESYMEGSVVMWKWVVILELFFWNFIESYLYLLFNVYNFFYFIISIIHNKFCPVNHLVCIIF